MARGGARPGAGRKVGATTTRTREIAEKVIATGLAPLEIMTMAAQHFVELANKTKDEEQKAAFLMQAANVAKDAAPYIHPKMAPKPPEDGDEKRKLVVNIYGGLPDDGSKPKA